ncbi:MAG: indolepyruvate oxidoreductase subunit beta [Bacteroidales bacterium]|nr:indolepyruvate oxidoreductase subunit beta [Bacteroidales bacterium]
MKKDIILAGVGGQGILSIAAIIGLVAVDSGLFLKQAEVHGMSQRGGDVQSNLRISDRPVASDLIPAGNADMIISVEPMEGLRYLPMLAPEGWLVSNSVPYNNIPDYPDVNLLISEIIALPKHVLLNADEIAEKSGNRRSANIAILGAASPFMGLDQKRIEHAIERLFGSKGTDVVESNLKAFQAGRDFALQQTK